MSQAAFAAALLDPERPAPEGLANPFGGPAGRRFDVYRNNVVAGLTDALATGFPVIRRLVGAEFFAAMAGVFLRAHPPEDPRLPLWGGRFPGFLAAFPPVARLPYLPDVARLELGLRQSYHAADAAPPDLDGLTPEAVLALAPRLAPATLVVRSRFPILDIWRANTGDGGGKVTQNAQDVLIARRGYDPAPHLLPPGGVAFARSLRGRTSLRESMSAALAAVPGADPAALLTLFVTTHALTLPEACP